MSIPGIKVSQSAIESYKAAHANIKTPANAAKQTSQEVINAFKTTHGANVIKDYSADLLKLEQESYAASHGNIIIGKNLDING